MATKKNNLPEVGTEQDEMAKLSTGALCALVFRECGEPGLRQILTALTEPVDDPGSAPSYGPREMLEDAANELEQRGLNQVASILLDVAVHCPSGLDHVPDYYRTSSGEKAVSEWSRHWVQNRERQLGIFERRLRHKGPSPADYQRVKPIPRPSHKD
jgi:hypothetical protein